MSRRPGLPIHKLSKMKCYKRHSTAWRYFTCCIVIVSEHQVFRSSGVQKYEESFEFCAVCIQTSIASQHPSFFYDAFCGHILQVTEHLFREELIKCREINKYDFRNIASAITGRLLEICRSRTPEASPICLGIKMLCFRLRIEKT